MAEKDGGQLTEEDDLREEAERPDKEEEKQHLRRPGRSLSASVVFGVLVSTVLWTLTGSPLLWVAYVGVIAFMLLHTGRTSRWRAVLFISMAWLFLVNKFFRGLLGFSYFVSYEEAFRGGSAQVVPNCHIAIGAAFLNYLYQQYLALKSGHWSDWGPLSLGLLWVGVPFIFGTAWCSWGCFYGGLDEGFSRVFRKPLIRWFRMSSRSRDLPSAILVFMMLISLTTMLPIFCLWICPLKLTSSFLDPVDRVRQVQAVIFMSVAVGALVLVPVLTKKRLFCGMICPFGAWQAFVGKVNPFKVRIDPEKCTRCQRCMRVCPTFCISPEGVKEHEIGPYCNGCGECIDACPDSAIRYTVLGRDTVFSLKGGPLAELTEVRTFFLFAYLLLGGAIGSLCLY